MEAAEVVAPAAEEEAAADVDAAEEEVAAVAPSPSPASDAVFTRSRVRFVTS